jgi:hypothetical protein
LWSEFSATGVPKFEENDVHGALNPSMNGYLAHRIPAKRKKSLERAGKADPCICEGSPVKRHGRPKQTADSFQETVSAESKEIHKT